jgi:hypothetical protein
MPHEVPRRCVSSQREGVLPQQAGASEPARLAAARKGRRTKESVTAKWYLVTRAKAALLRLAVRPRDE